MILVKNFWLFIVWMAVIIFLSFTPLPGWPQVKTLEQLGFDKFVHICMYTMLSFLLLRSFFKQQNNHTPRYSIIISSALFCAIMGASIEILQPILTMFRKFEWLDMISDATGAVCGYYLFSWLIKKQWLGMKSQPTI